MLQRITRPLLFALIASFVHACGMTSPREQPPEEVDFFQPREWGTWERTDDGPRVPSGLHPGADFEWTQDNRPVYFHTIEESERTRPEWEPFFRDAEGLFDREKIALHFKIGTFYRHDVDAHIEALSEQFPGDRGGFWGFGPPLADARLHMFECPRGQVRHYIVRDYVIECVGSGFVDVFVISDPDAPNPPPYAPDDPRPGAPEGLPARWQDWLLEAREADYPELKRLRVYAYESSEDLGISTERLIRVGAGSITDWGPLRWSGEARLIPAEHCLESRLDDSRCVSSHAD